MPGAELKFVPNGSKLEGRVKGPTVTTGYLRDPQRTAAAFEGGWHGRTTLALSVTDDPKITEPFAARAYALLGAVGYDAFIASQDGKFTYWYIRPHQLDPAIVPLFTMPPPPEKSLSRMKIP